MKYLIIGLVSLFPLLTLGQDTSIKNDSISKEDKLKMARWYLEITGNGVVKTEDSIKFSKEFIKVLNDENYRTVLFPETYTWEKAVTLIKYKQVRQAFWYFINLYPQNETNKELVVKSILAYDQAFKMDEMLINVFYTYSFMDPRISVVTDGKPEIIRPDILEEKLENVKEMVAYIHAYRKQQEDLAKTE